MPDLSLLGPAMVVVGLIVIAVATTANYYHNKYGLPDLEPAEASAEADCTTGSIDDEHVAGMAELTRLLTTGTDMPGVVVFLDQDLGDNAVALDVDQCGHTPMVLCGTAWLEGPRLAMQGTLAHEVAHHALRHTRSSARTLLPWLPRVALAGAAGALLGGSTWIAALILLAAPLARLVCLRQCRRHELEADVHAVTLLNAVGLPGTASLTAVLDGIAATEPRWYRALGWVTATHPPVRARRRHLASVTVPIPGGDRPARGIGHLQEASDA